MKIAAGQFKAKCLKLMETVRRTRQEIIITKRGRPVAKLVPVVEEMEPRSPLGSMAGTVETCADIIEPIGEAWDADR